jgi:hypothetical protein
MGDTRGAASFHAPAQAYDRFVGRYGRALARELVDAAGVRAASVRSTSAAGRAR